MDTQNISMRIMLLAGCIFCQIAYMQAQQADSALMHIKYELIHVDDTNFRDNPRKEEMIVYIGRQSAMYNSFTRAATLAKMKQDIENRQRADGSNADARNGTNRSRLFVSAPHISSETLYLFPKKNEAFVANTLGSTTYIIPQDYPQIDWQISETAKEIGGYMCQQATGAFGGRLYTAWFTMELPFPYGPWKLHGLPGLILEAEDSKGEVIFRYAGFDKETGPSVEIALPEDAQTTTAKAFAKAKAAFDKNPMAYAMRNIEAPAGAKIERKIVMKDQNGRELSPEQFQAMREMAMREGKMKRPNNPLELVN